MESFEHTIRGETFNFKYEEIGSQRNLSIEGEKISSIQTHTLSKQSLTEKLKSVGIYTRLEDIVKWKGPSLTVILKPAASVELRDENGVLVKRVLSNPFEGNVISKRATGYQYTATIGMDIIREMDFKDKQKLSIVPTIKTGNLAFVVKEQEKLPQTTLQIKSTGVITIPSVFGSMADLDGHGISWEVTSDSIIGETTVELETVPPADIVETSSTEIINIKQEDLKNDTTKWDQERYQTYLKSPVVSRFDIDEKDSFKLSFVQFKGDLGVKYDIIPTQKYDKKQPNIKPIYLFGNNQRNIYLPNALVEGLGWRGKLLEWNLTESNLISIGQDI